MSYSDHRMLCAKLISGLLLPSLLCVYSFPQGRNVKRDATTKSQSVYAVKVSAVVVKVFVTDESGNPINDLTERDFRVYDDGSPQEIQTFALEPIDTLESDEDETVAPDTPSPRRSKLNLMKHDSAKPPRLISIVIDDLTMESAPGPGSVLDFPRIVDVVRKFVKSDMNPTDQVTILSGSRNVQFPFTDNKRLLLQALDTLPKKLNSSWAVRADRMSDYEAWMWANGLATESIGKMTEWNRIQALVQNDDVRSRTCNLLYTIRQHLRVLRHFEGIKMVVLFSDGFVIQVGPRTGAAETHQLQEIVDLALRSGIILNTVSTRSISADFETVAPEGSGETRTAGEKVTFSIPSDMDRVMQEQPMEQIASETGGKFLPTSNDMYIGLKSIVNSQHSCYVLTYAMPPHKPDGAYHHIKLEVTRPGLELSYRKGYHGPTEELTFETTKREDLMEALHSPGNMREIPISLSYSFSQEDPSTYAVSFFSRVNIEGLRFVKEDARRRNQISLVLAAFDENDNFISGLEKAIDFQLLEDSYNSLRERGIASKVELKLPMGRYRIKAVVRESAEGKMGSIARSIEIP